MSNDSDCIIIECHDVIIITATDYNALIRKMEDANSDFSLLIPNTIFHLDNDIYGSVMAVRMVKDGNS